MCSHLARQTVQKRAIKSWSQTFKECEIKLFIDSYVRGSVWNNWYVYIYISVVIDACWLLLLTLLPVISLDNVRWISGWKSSRLFQRSEMKIGLRRCVFDQLIIPKDPQIPSEGRDYTGWNLLWGWDPIRLEGAWMDSYKLVSFKGLPKVTRIYKYGQIYSTPLKFNSSPLKRGGWTTSLPYWKGNFSGANMLNFRRVTIWSHFCVGPLE